MDRRLIGYGYTNSNGVATLDYDASGTSISPSGYTGVGAGVINIQAELHDDSTVVSVPCNVLDTIFRDGATSSDKNDDWYNQESYWSITPSDTGKSISCSQNSMQSYWAKGGSSWSTGQIYECPICCEFDLLEVSGNISWYIMGDSFVSHGFSANATGHYKFIIDGEYVEKIKDGQYITPKYAKTMTGKHLIGFRATTGSLKYANFVIYPI